MIFLVSILFLFIGKTCPKIIITTDDKISNNGFSIPKFVKSAGFPIEIHKNIETQDGYLLDIHRIPNGRNNLNKSGQNKPVVFFMHGLTASAEVWLVNGPNRSLPFLLADKGYDVWLGNSRGTSHSKKHIFMSPFDANFWDYSWHEIGVYDLPAMLDYVLNITSQSQLIYFGHSQGGTSFLVMTSTRPEMNEKIKLMVGFGPAVYGLVDLRVPPEKAAPLFVTFEFFRTMFAMYEFGPNVRMLLCNDWFKVQKLCNLALISLSLISGLNPDQTDKAILPTFLQVYPDSSSVRQYFHYLQVFVTGLFRQYDFGPEENRKKYGKLMPPLYNLTKVTAPVAIFYGKSDFLVSPMSAEKLIKQLPNVVFDHLMSYEDFNHMDFVWAKDIVEMLYPHVYPLLDKYTDK